MNAPHTVSVHLGTPPEGYQEWKTTNVHFHGFADLSAVAGVGVDSPEFAAFGSTWCLRLHPGGRMSSLGGWVSIHLVNLSNKSFEMQFGFSIKGGLFAFVASMQSSTPTTFAPVSSPKGSSRGWRDYAERSTIIDSLVDGTLVVEVHMKPHEPIKAALPQFIPENPFCNNMLQMFNDEESADIVFEVGKHQSKNNAEKVAKIAPVKFHAHFLILKAGSAMLADLCQSKGDLTTPIEITDVSPDVFRHLLYYIYGGKILDDDIKTNAKDIIDAANRYGVATLKLEAEACLVEGTTFSMENVMDHLIYADSMNCALLKEASMDYIAKNRTNIIGKISFNDAPGNLMNDLLAAVVRGDRNEGGAHDEENEYRFTSINELRRKAHEQGLEVDGSREMLITALKANL